MASTPSRHSALFARLTVEQEAALKRIVGDWIGEGFTTPPYGDAYYDIFEALDLDRNRKWSYDTRRRGGRRP